ncbi:B3 domain-containing protein Os04g0386900-like [Cornus florida]|uniref:B3 domain-containing protein Os04g0386900-like n=1 Tax=Cornus florida TaxID=4283 RepID=UPI002899283E|nr:B3 domain-containing protein Os04g0386900-like [Cornus florida]
MDPLASAPEAELKMPLPQVQHVENLQMDTHAEDDDYWPLSKKPNFHTFVLKTHLKPLYQMVLPTKMQSVLPQATVPVILSCRGKKWETSYYGDRSNKRFDFHWKTFAIDNNLNYGDGLVFELQECSSGKVEFRVQILRGDFPPELLARVNGATSISPIVID